MNTLTLASLRETRCYTKAAGFLNFVLSCIFDEMCQKQFMISQDRACDQWCRRRWYKRAQPPSSDSKGCSPQSSVNFFEVKGYCGGNFLLKTKWVTKHL